MVSTAGPASVSGDSRGKTISSISSPVALNSSDLVAKQ
jgi:hypothetical protein